MNIEVHTDTDADGRTICFFMTAGKVSDYMGAAALLDSLPSAEWLLPTAAMIPTVQRCIERQGDKAAHPGPAVAWQTCQIR